MSHSPATTGLRRHHRSNLGRDALLRRAIPVEFLENRILLTGMPVNLAGDAQGTTFELLRAGDNVDFFQNEPESATPTLVAPYATLGPISLAVFGGDGSVAVDFTGGNPIGPGGLAFSNGDTNSIERLVEPSSIHFLNLPAGAGVSVGFHTLAVNSGSGTDSFTDTIQIPAVIGDYDIANGPGPYAITDLNTRGTTTFDRDFGGTGAAVSLVVSSGAVVNFTGTQHLAALDIANGGSVAMVPSGGQVIDTNTLSIEGTLDLANNDLIVNDPASSADSLSGGDDSSTIQQAVAAGYNYAVAGTGAPPQGIIFSSTAVAGGQVLGVAPVADVGTIDDNAPGFNYSEPGTPSLDGQSIPATAVVARYTLPGDATLDGSVNSADLGEVLSHYNNPVDTDSPDWYHGNVVYATATGSTINYADLGNVLANYNP